ADGRGTSLPRLRAGLGFGLRENPGCARIRWRIAKHDGASAHCGRKQRQADDGTTTNHDVLRLRGGIVPLEGTSRRARKNGETRTGTPTSVRLIGAGPKWGGNLTATRQITATAILPRQPQGIRSPARRLSL